MRSDQRKPFLLLASCQHYANGEFQRWRLDSIGLRPRPPDEQLEGARQTYKVRLDEMHTREYPVRDGTLRHEEVTNNPASGS